MFQQNISALQSGQGIAAIEARMQQIEAMLAQMRGVQNPAAVNNASSSFASFLEPKANETQTNYPTLAPLNRVPGNSQKSTFLPLIKALSAQHGMDSKLVAAVVQQESGFNPGAVSSAGASGLMQLMPGTAKALGVQNSQDPSQNLDGGIRYLKQLLGQFNGNIPLALAAYNAGPNAVTQHGGIPPYPETQKYVKNILANYLANRNS